MFEKTRNHDKQMHTEKKRQTYSHLQNLLTDLHTLVVHVVCCCRRICSANYHTVTELSFQPYKENCGKEPLPNSVHQVGTGFVRQKPITNPTDAEVGQILHQSHRYGEGGKTRHQSHRYGEGGKTHHQSHRYGAVSYTHLTLPTMAVV